MQRIIPKIAKIGVRNIEEKNIIRIDMPNWSNNNIRLVLFNTKDKKYNNKINNVGTIEMIEEINPKIASLLFMSLLRIHDL